jgi:hypothetical protein
MNRSLIASFAALGIVATPALAATPAAKTTKAKAVQQHTKVSGAMMTKASAKTSKSKKPSN